MHEGNDMSIMITLKKPSPERPPILGALTCVHQALAAAGCARIDTSGDEAEALALIARERMDPVLVAWEAFHDGLALLHVLRRTPAHRQVPVCFIFEAAGDVERVVR